MMHSTTISEAFLGEPLNLDLDPIVFQLWLQGHDVESVTERQQIVAQNQWVMTDEGGAGAAGGAGEMGEIGHLQRERLKQFVREDIEHQYRVLNMLRRYLKKPHRMLQGHFPYQLSFWQQSALIEGYYRFDVELVRNVLGKNLTDTLSRKECESLANRAHISVDDCIRQMCNLKRVYQAQDISELSLYDFSSSAFYPPPQQPNEDCVVYFYRKHFGFSFDLASRYARIIFLSRYRFETHKTRLILCSYADFDFFAQQLKTHWGVAPPLPGQPEKPYVSYHVSSSSISALTFPPSTLTPPTTPSLIAIPSSLRSQSGGSPAPSLEVKPVKSLPGFEGGLLDTAFLVELKELKTFEKDKKSMEEYVNAVANSLELAVPAKPEPGRSRTPSAFLKGNPRHPRALSPSVASREPTPMSTPTGPPVGRGRRGRGAGPISPTSTLEVPAFTFNIASSTSSFSATSSSSTTISSTTFSSSSSATSSTSPPIAILAPSTAFTSPSVITITTVASSLSSLPPPPPPPTVTNILSHSTLTLPVTPRTVKVRSASDKLIPSESTGSLQTLSKSRVVVAPSSAPPKPSSSSAFSSSSSPTLTLPPSATPTISLPPPVLKKETIKLSQASKLKARYTRDLIKSLTNIAISLEKGKNLRNFFADLAETAVRPLTKLGLTGAEVERFFEILQENMPPKMLQREELCILWRRFLSAVAPIFLVLYCRVADPGAPALSRYPQEEITTENRPSIEVTATDLAREIGEDFEEEYSREQTLSLLQ